MTDQQKIEAAKRELAGCINSSQITKALCEVLTTNTEREKSVLTIMETYHGMLVAVYEMLDK